MNRDKTNDVLREESEAIVQDRITRFRKWQQKLVENPDVMGGEAVFPKSRLTVRHVGEMLERGESAEVVLRDYPYLTSEDLEMSRMYLKTHPRVGRPESEK